MAIAKKLRFVANNINVNLDMPTIPFPPLKFKTRELTLNYLGKSNKTDLYPGEEECDVGILKAISNKQIGQFVYCSDIGDMYEAFIYVDEVENVILRSLRTRLQ